MPMSRTLSEILLCIGLCLSALTSAHAGTSGSIPTVCVAPFADNTGVETWQAAASGFADLLLAGLSRQDIPIVERERLLDVVKEQGLTLRGVTRPAVSARVGHLVGADKFISGGLMLVDGKLNIIAHVFDVKTGTIQKSVKVVGKPEEVVELALTLAARIGEALSVKLDTGPVDKLDTNPISSLHFLRGLGFFHAANFSRAAMEFMICGDLEPEHETFRYWIGQCYFRLGEFEHARIEFTRFVNDYPDHDKRSEAGRLLETCKEKLKTVPVPPLIPTKKAHE